MAKERDNLYLHSQQWDHLNESAVWPAEGQSRLGTGNDLSRHCETPLEIAYVKDRTSMLSFRGQILQSLGRSRAMLTTGSEGIEYIKIGLHYEKFLSADAVREPVH